MTIHLKIIKLNRQCASDLSESGPLKISDFFFLWPIWKVSPPIVNHYKIFCPDPWGSLQGGFLIWAPPNWRNPKIGSCGYMVDLMKIFFLCFGTCLRGLKNICNNFWDWVIFRSVRSKKLFFKGHVQAKKAQRGYIPNPTKLVYKLTIGP